MDMSPDTSYHTFPCFQKVALDSTSNLVASVILISGSSTSFLSDSSPESASLSSLSFACSSSGSSSSGSLWGPHPYQIPPQGLQPLLVSTQSPPPLWDPPKVPPPLWGPSKVHSPL